MRAAHIAAIGLKLARLGLVGKIDAENHLQTRDQAGIFDGEDNFDAVAQVAAHEVGAAKIDFLGAAIFKVINSAVLEEAPDDALHLDRYR